MVYYLTVLNKSTHTPSSNNPSGHYARKTDGTATVRFFLYKIYTFVKNIDRGDLMKNIKIGEKFKKTTYSVIAIALCAVALFSFWLSNKDNNGVLPEETDVFTPTEAKTEKEIDIQVNTPVTNVPDTRQEQTTDESKPLLSVSFVSPLGNSITKQFSRDELVKNNTTGDWRIHKGIDIKGVSGDRINAISDGIVTDLVYDELWGTVVTIDHDNGFVAKYYGLRKNSTVNPGDKIKTNDKVGLLDEIPIESSDGIHLHFEMYKDGQAISPSDYLGKKVDISK